MNRIVPRTSVDLADLAGAEAALADAGGGAVALLRGSEVVAYLVPAEQAGEVGHRVATREQVMAHLRETRAEVQPVVDYLRDK